ncbi:hypothetical protein SMICM304S_04916 [Streptomyces microflavus]
MEAMAEQHPHVHELLELEGLVGGGVAGALGLQHAEREFFLGREVGVERTFRDPGDLEYFGNGGRLVAMLLEVWPLPA